MKQVRLEHIEHDRGLGLGQAQKMVRSQWVGVSCNGGSRIVISKSNNLAMELTIGTIIKAKDPKGGAVYVNADHTFSYVGDFGSEVLMNWLRNKKLTSQDGKVERFREACNLLKLVLRAKRDQIEIVTA